MSSPSSRWQIAIDSNKCTGHGRCYSVAPDLFTCDEEGFGQVITADVDLSRERMVECVAICPESAVSANPL